MGKQVRSAITGKFVGKSEATKHPKTTVTETTKKKK
ncbi:MAG: multidrug transporter [Nitrospirae bacterium]|nr:multidrug transporter [Nitrospirota bacterium]